MNWYKKAQIDQQILSQLNSLDTRSKANVSKANELILKTLDIKVGDVLRSTSGMSSGVDKNYKVLSINPDFSINLLAMETERQMPNSRLFNALKRNMPAWEKVIQ